MNNDSRARGALLRLAVVVVLAVALLPLSADVAWACLCQQVTPSETVRRADAVFTGVARGRSASERVGFEARIDFAVETVYKGDVPSRWSVSVDASSCGYVFADGERYTVFASAARTNLCMGNVKGAIDPASYGVQPIVVYPSDRLIDLDRAFDRLALAAILVGLGAILAVRLRRSRSA